MPPPPMALPSRAAHRQPLHSSKLPPKHLLPVHLNRHHLCRALATPHRHPSHRQAAPPLPFALPLHAAHRPLLRSPLPPPQLHSHREAEPPPPAARHRRSRRLVLRRLHCRLRRRAGTLSLHSVSPFYHRNSTSTVNPSRHHLYRLQPSLAAAAMSDLRPRTLLRRLRNNNWEPDIPLIQALRRRKINSPL